MYLAILSSDLHHSSRRCHLQTVRQRTSGHQSYKKCPQDHSPCFNPPQYKVTGRRGGTFDCFKIPLFCFGRCENSNIPLVYFTFYSTLRFGGTRCGHCIAWPRLERQLFRLAPLFVFVFVFAYMFVFVFFFENQSF